MLLFQVTYKLFYKLLLTRITGKSKKNFLRSNVKIILWQECIDFTVKPLEYTVIVDVNDY